MRRFLQIASLILLGLILLICLAYLGLALYYKGGFSYGTYINGVYCTGKTVEQVSKELNQQFEAGRATVDADGSLHDIDLNAIDYSYDFESSLRQYLDCQNSFLWIENLGGEKRRQILAPTGRLDDSKLKSIVDSFRLEDTGLPRTVTIEHTEEGYVLKDGKNRVIDADASYSYIQQSLLEGCLNIVLDDSCYTSVPYTEEEVSLIDIYNRIQSFQSSSFTYTLGDKSIVLDSGTLAGMLATDDEGIPLVDVEDGLVLDETLVKESLEAGLKDINTYHNHDFMTHDGELVHLDKGTLGTQIDIDEEAAYLIEAVKAGETEYVREPSYKSFYSEPGSDDIGDTYIEVDISDQMLYYYEKGDCTLETQVVTGKVSTHQDTPTGVYYIYKKKSPAVLKGPGYAEPVNYWMPVYKGIGIHDSSWRTVYGGDIYLTGGSHGCINTPKDKVAIIYDSVQVGTPVIIHE